MMPLKATPTLTELLERVERVSLDPYQDTTFNDVRTLRDAVAALLRALIEQEQSQ